MGQPQSSDVEVEWQLDALDLRPVERWLAALREPALTSTGDPGTLMLTATPRPAERLLDTYLDTDDWRIGRSGYVLRVRQRGGRSEITMKDTAEAEDGLRRRLEVTEPLPAGGVEALGHEGPVGWRLRALIGRRPLVEVLEVRTRRRPFDLHSGDTRVGEVALDETTIVMGDDHQPVRLQRVEVEVEPSWVEPLTPVIDGLRLRCGLQPATLSKFQAGLLAAGRQVPAPPELGPTDVSRDSSLGDVAFAVLRRSFGAMLAHEAGTRLGEDPEDLHDMRVATRRMRAALSLFTDALPVRARHVRIELGWLADALGAVRDLDVQIETLEQWRAAAAPEDRAALEELGRLLGADRADARVRLLACLDSARYERLVAGFTTMLRQGPSRRSAAARAPAAAVVPELVGARHRAATKAARRARRSGEPADFHRTRIRAKRLRYALEFASDLYEGHTRKYVRRVVRLQDALGLMQDARVAAGRLHDLVRTEGNALSPLTVFVMGGVAQRYRHEAERLARDVPNLLDKLRGQEWKRLTGLMERRRLELGALYRWPTPVPAPVSAPVSSTGPVPPDAGSPESAGTGPTAAETTPTAGSTTAAHPSTGERVERTLGARRPRQPAPLWSREQTGDASRGGVVRPPTRLTTNGDGSGFDEPRRDG